MYMSPHFFISLGCFAVDLRIVTDMLHQNLVHFKLNFNEKLPFSCFCNFAAMVKKIPFNFFSIFQKHLLLQLKEHH